MTDFVHLDVQTHLDLYGSTIRVPALVERVRELGMDTVAITDRVGLFALPEARAHARRHGVKVIVGCTLDVAPAGRHDRTNRTTHDLVLLARDAVGYRNLVRLATAAYVEGCFYRPRVDLALLRQHARGLVALSGCDGEVVRALARGDRAAAERAVADHRAIFEGNFFLALDPGSMPQGSRERAEVVALAARSDVPLVATARCRHLEHGDAASAALWRALRGLGGSAGAHVMSPAEIADHFVDVPEALANTAAIARRCAADLGVAGRPWMPAGPRGGASTADEALRALVDRGLEARFAVAAAAGCALDGPRYRDRCDLELDAIARHGVADYFLVLAELVTWAKDRGIPVGPGRGMGPGSIIAWATRITEVDPIEHGLIFERFFNVERSSPPDIELDVCAVRGEAILEHAEDMYGRESVGRPARFHRATAGALVRLVARAAGRGGHQAASLARLVPHDPWGSPVSFRAAIEGVPALGALVAGLREPWNRIDLVERLEGLATHIGSRTDAIVVTPTALRDHVPCFVGRGGETISQLDDRGNDAAGLVTYHLHHLPALSVLAEVARRVVARRDGSFDLARVRIDDAAVFEMISRGETDGVFQLESRPTRRLLERLRPERLEHVFAITALHRPGPLECGVVDAYVAGRHGARQVWPAHPEVDAAVADTYGVLVYQEQLMRIAHLFAGMPMTRADLVRRALGRRDPAITAEHRRAFVEGAVARGVDAEVATGVFDRLAAGAGFAFNRSHAAAYGLLSYQTAYVKHHYPVEMREATAEVREKLPSDAACQARESGSSS